MAKPIKDFYVPDSIPRDYKYIVPNNDGSFYDLYNTISLQPGEKVKYYRFHYELDDDMYQPYDRVNNDSVIKYVGSVIEINPVSNYWNRRDYPQILFCSTVIILAIVVILNIVTSLIKKGGVFSGLL